MMLLWRAHSLLPRRGLRLLERHVSSAPSAVDAQRLKGTTYNKKTGKWQAIITVDGKRSVLGSFDDVKQAADAYAAAKAVVKDQQYQTNRKKNGAGGEAATPAAPAPPPVELHPTFRGVMREVGVPLWEAVLRVEGGEDSKEISGGEYETPEEAARAYDALARMYLGADAPTNFPMNTYEAWVPPEAVLTTGQIETRVGEPLTVAEIETALRTERGEDIRVVPLAGRSDLADHMIFVTGKSVSHMRKMADMVARALRKRQLPGVDPTVEARDMDDWMVVDCGNIIVNVMDAEAREVFALESFYEGMTAGEDPYAGMSYDEWLAANPVHPKWIARLQRDEEELDAMQRLR